VTEQERLQRKTAVIIEKQKREIDRVEKRALSERAQRRRWRWRLDDCERLPQRDRDYPPLTLPERAFVDTLWRLIDRDLPHVITKGQRLALKQIHRKLGDEESWMRTALRAD
jgi:hypothetical protein